MHRLMLLLGMATALIATSACGQGPSLPLAIVAARNAADTVKRLLAESAVLDERDGKGLTALMWAARSGAVDAMRVLLDAGADPNARDHGNGWTPLLHAVHTRHPEAVRLLLERRADPNAAAGGLTPLWMAAADDDPDLITNLLEHGADPSMRGPGGSTALSQAVGGGAFSDIDRPFLGGCHPAAVRAVLAHDPTLRLPNTIAAREALFFARLQSWSFFKDDRLCVDVLRLIGNPHGRPASDQD
jgi:hypothetical protein